MNKFYTHYKAVFLLLFWAVYTPLSINAQTVTSAWATLTSGARPNAIIVDAAGNVYTANYRNGTVSKISPDGVLTADWATSLPMIGGTGPADIATDGSGNFYTANNNTHNISKITSTGSVTGTWISMPTGTYPTRIVIDASGNLYVMNGNNTISKITAAGSLTQTWVSLSSTAAPYGIVIDAAGNLYTANYGDNTVSKITSSGTVTPNWATLASDATPRALAIDASGNIYTANSGNNTISKITSGGTVTQAWATLASGATPRALAIDASGNVYTANSNNTISKVTPEGTLTQAWATLASGSNPLSIVIDASDNIYTGNWNNNTVSKIVPIVLPVEILSFIGKNTERSNLLTWETTNEVNNKGFQIERLNTSGNWDIIGFKTANNKASNYQFIDKNPLPISYYRLRQIDNDGTETLSKVISIQTKDTKGKLAIYPNPVSNLLTVENTEGGNFQILNLLGQQVLSGKTTQQLDVSALPQGTYIFKMGAEQVKFVKQ